MAQLEWKIRDNFYGQLGIRGGDLRYPKLVGEPLNHIGVVQIAAGNNFSCALTGM